jgi:hypothetical protein
VRRRLALAAALGLALALALPASALAHGLVGKQDLPIPRWLFAWAAAAVLVISFVALAVLWPRPRLEHARERAVLKVPAVLEVLCGVLGVLQYGWIGQVSAAARDRLRGSLQASLNRISVDFGVEIAAAARALLPADIASDSATVEAEVAAGAAVLVIGAVAVLVVEAVAPAVVPAAALVSVAAFFDLDFVVAAASLAVAEASPLSAFLDLLDFLAVEASLAVVEASAVSAFLDFDDFFAAVLSVVAA